MKKTLKSKKTVQTLYAYISVPNHRWLAAQAKIRGISVSEFVDEMIDTKRGKNSSHSHASIFV
jgi:hypothetical protein